MEEFLTNLWENYQYTIWIRSLFAHGLLLLLAILILKAFISLIQQIINLFRIEKR